MSGDEARCPACESLEIRVWRPGVAPSGDCVYVCDACHVGFSWPRRDPRELAASYGSTYYGTQGRRLIGALEGFVARWRRQRAQEIARRHAPGSVLDVGCGRGWTLHHLRELGWTVEGIELDDLAAQHARDGLHLPVSDGGFQVDDPREDHFDAIIIWHVLEHLPDAPRALATLARLLKPGGVLSLAVPNLASWQARATGYAWFHLDLPRHVWHFQADDLCRRLESLGLSIVAARHLSWEQNPFGWLQSLLNRLGLPHNLLYDLLRRDSARWGRAPWRRRPLAAVASVLVAILLAPLAVVLSLLEAAVRAGGTIEIMAQRRGNAPR